MRISAAGRERIIDIVQNGAIATGDVYPQAFDFADLVDAAKDDLVINPASESLVLDLETIKGQ